MRDLDPSEKFHAHNGDAGNRYAPARAPRLTERARPPTAEPESPARRSRHSATPSSDHGIVSQNPRMMAVFELIRQVAETTTTVLIEGETGTGKELVARALHHASTSRTGPLVAINCASVPEHLLESELFGHEKGSFTGALALRRGRFELADGGTLFLDEVGDVPAAMQCTLLRVLQERCFERVGGSHPVAVDVRVVGATNRSLAAMVRAGTFREDLYYRLDVVRIVLPPLRERQDDIPLLAAHFAAKHARPGEPAKRISAPAMAELTRHSWPGNVRELENAIERACVTTRGDTIDKDQLLLDAVDSGDRQEPVRLDPDRPLAELLQRSSAAIEEEYIRQALQKTHGHIARCARLCGFSRRTLSTKLTQYRIATAEFKYQ